MHANHKSGNNVVFILSDAYSGSTLLDLLLGSHSRIFGLGEVDPESFDAFLDENQTCTCLLNASECYFWKKVLQRLQDGNGRFRLGPSENPMTILKNTVDLFKAAQSVAEAEILVDSTKRLQRIQLLVNSAEIHGKVIHLIRDGRGVGYSRMKRGEKFSDAVLHWIRVNHEIREWLASRGAPAAIEVRYEDLCAAPQQVLGKICEFLGVPHEIGMLRIDRRIHHNVRGNPMRFVSGKSAICADEQWRSQLGSSELAVFANLTSGASYAFGH